MDASRPRVLLVDDESVILDSIRRVLARDFDVHTALGAEAGLQEIRKSPPFDVIVSDLRMPNMDGITFFGRARVESADSTRILLTGNADLQDAAAAVNEGNIFRFLFKPCSSKHLVDTVWSGVSQYRLVTAERVLLQKTLLGSVKMLTEILALASPTAFGRALRIKDRSSATARAIGEPKPWEMEMAAMLSHVAHITLPTDTLDHLYDGKVLSDQDNEMVARLPEVAESLLADIPRLENVREILRHPHSPSADESEDDVGGPPIGARILQAAIALDVLESQDMSPQAALSLLREADPQHDPVVVKALAATLASASDDTEVREISVAQLRKGMVFVDSVESMDGRLLVARGQEVSVSLLERLTNFNKNEGIRQPFRVVR